jgi:hypothetical protein
MVNVYSWLYFHKRQVLAGCAIAITLILVLMLFLWSNHSTKEALKEYELPPAPIHKRPLPWDTRVVYY